MKKNRETKDFKLNSNRKKIGLIIIIILILMLAGYIYYVNTHQCDEINSDIITDENLDITTEDDSNIIIYDKPVIYFYPEETMEIFVKLITNENLIVTYPAYNEGWEITANANGTLINNIDGLEYSYLFWEAEGTYDYDMTTGFVVKGEDVEKFLKEKLSYLGLIPEEYNEFIVYWLPKMINNEYNLITFQFEDYTSRFILEIMPEPDSILRVFMTYKALDEYIEIDEQELISFERVGFTVIEWGGAEIKN